MSDWPDLATTDPEQIAAWAARYPGANLGIATGTVSGMIALDVDPKSGGPDTLARLIAEHGPLPVTPEQRTGSGGSHFYFRVPPGLTVTNTASKIGPGLDVRGDGGLVVVAPSRSDKGRYSWTRPPWDTPTADAPAWLVERLGRAPGATGPVPDGARGYFPPASQAVLDAARKALEHHGPAIDGMGGGLHTVQAAAILTHDHALTDEEALPLFLEWNETCIPPWEPADLEERLRRGRKYGKKPYGCARSLDTVTAARKMIADWQATGSDDPMQLLSLVRQLQWDDPAKRRLILNALKASTGIGFRDLNLPPAVDLEALAAREARQRAFADERGNLLDPSEPLDVARRFQARNADGEGRPEIVRWNGDYLRAYGTHYEITSDEAISKALYEFTDGKRDVVTGAPVKPDRAMIEELNHALKAVAQIQVASPPAWLDPCRGDPSAADVIAFPNGILTVTGSREFLAPSRRLFNVNVLGFPYVPNAPRPVQWERFLDDVWPDDVESRETLQELMGLLLTGDTRYQKIFMLIGPKRSGKGTIGRVLQALVGEGNHCSPTLNGLGGPFGAEPLIGKRLAMIWDARLGHRADVSAVAERLLSISGEDAQTVDRKHRTAWTAKLAVRFVIMTNEVPALLDQSGALASRFVILRMTRSFLGKEDLSLTSRLLQELPGIFLWTLEGLDRLRARGQFRQPKSAAELVDQLDTLASPIKAFVRERCDLDPHASVESALLYSEYRRYMESQGRERSATHPVFTRDLGSAFPEVAVTRPRNANGEQVRHYRGIRLRVTDLQAA